MAGLANPEAELPIISGGGSSKTKTQSKGELDMLLVEDMLYEFVEDISRPSLVLPPMPKEARAKMHQLATAFHLKSKSQGKGDARFTTLYRTTKTGTLGVKHWKISRLVYGAGGGGGTGAKGKGRHQEGEVVGRGAEKIGAANLGFKMLERMGCVDFFLFLYRTLRISA